MKITTVKSLRLKLLWDQLKLSQELGVTKAAISHWETGCRAPKLKTIAKLIEIARNNKIKVDFSKLINKD